jgi:alanine-glyoxylate transaminase/serine-glyoxylate transaminase/serine-pyruvate transaminase
VNGVFGERLAEVAERSGGQVARIERPWGEVFSVDEVAKALERHRPRVVCLVMAETSTGAWQPLEEIAQVVRQAGALLVVDAVTALGGVPLEVDAWGLDVVYSGTQKCLSCPPGLAPITFGPRAVEAIHARKTKMASWYFDVSLLSQYWGSDRVYHHTAPINMTYALHEALRLVLDEGLEASWKRHDLAHRALKAGLAALGIGYASDAAHTLPQLNAVWVPPGVDDAEARKRLLTEFGIEIGGGLGQYKGRVWRIGLMGQGARRASVYRFLAALEELLPRYGVQLDAGAGTAAAAAVFRA